MYSNFYMLFCYQLISISLFVSLIMNIVQSAPPSSAVCFLTRQPSVDTVRFAFELAQNIPSIDVFITVDDNTMTTLPMASPIVRFLQFNETICRKYGFQEFSVVGTSKTCSAWDKAFYYFSRQSTHHLFVWFIEDDVFIPSIQAFRSLHDLYSTSYDLVTAEMEYNVDGYIRGWPHWRLAPGIVVIPWAHGMVCAVGCSRRLLSAVNEHAQWQGRLAFNEFLLPTLAIHDSKMKIITPFELDTVVWRKNYFIEEIQARPYNWWHPIKGFDQQKEWRARLLNKSSVNESNILITLNSITEQLNNNGIANSTDVVKSQMKKLLDQFELVKGQINSSRRHQLRNQFLRLTANRSDIVRSTAILLADHAFNLPEDVADKIIKINKTAIHLKLEEAIENDKQMILYFMKNDNPTSEEMVKVTRLRKETIKLIHKLTFEIQCEQQLPVCNRSKKHSALNYAASRYTQTTITNQPLTIITVVLLCILLIIYRLTIKKYLH